MPPASTQNRGFRGTSTTTRTTCRVCGSGQLLLLVDYGQMPLAGGFLTADELEYQAAFPLRLARCADCTEMQLVNDGSDGEPAILRGVGHDAESPFMASLLNC